MVQPSYAMTSKLLVDSWSRIHPFEGRKEKARKNKTGENEKRERTKLRLTI
jgi:hypothetical protein